MKKLIALFLVFSIISLYTGLYSKERRGANVEIYKTKSKTKMEGTPWETPDIKGELIAVKESSLLLLDSDSGADVSIDIGDIRVITIMKKSNIWKGAGYGLLFGGVIGGLAGISFEAGINGWGFGYIFIPIIGLVGALIGGVNGASARIDKTIKFEGKSDSEIKDILEDLRKKARVPNFQ
jgi:hypothetical protein